MIPYSTSARESLSSFHHLAFPLVPSYTLQENTIMPATPRKSGASSSTPAEVSLVQLGNCLVNLPSALTAVLENANTVRIM